MQLTLKHFDPIKQPFYLNKLLNKQENVTLDYISCWLWLLQ